MRTRTTRKMWLLGIMTLLLAFAAQATVLVDVDFNEPGKSIGQVITSATNNGTLNNFTGSSDNIVFAAGTAGSDLAANFSTGSNGDILSMAGFPGIGIAQDFTLAFSVARTGDQVTTNPSTHILDLPNSGGPGVDDITRFTEATAVRMKVGDRAFTPNVPLGDGVWTHITMVHQANTHGLGSSGSNEGTGTLYTNGTFFATVVLVDNANLPAGSMALGGQLDGARALKGKLDNVYLEDVALNATQVEALYGSTLIPEPASVSLLALGAAAVMLRRRRG